MVPKKKEFKSKSLQSAFDRYVGDDPKHREIFEQAVAEYDVARKIFDLRTNAGLSQRELARRVGTTASVICQLEDADYQGHSLLMLRRIASALNKRVEIRFVSLGGKQQSA